ncbi:MAG: cupin domain-containing protein [Bryobacteraceae bacterium]|nr:cupin domain-containing protein [Bryobacteraceae bacterium]
MSETIVRNLFEHGQVPESSILSSTLQNDDFSKFVLFRFAPGQELSAHTAPFPATLYFVSGEADVKLGDAIHQLAAGAWAYMPAQLPHGIKARTEVVMLLTMLKGAR